METVITATIERGVDKTDEEVAWLSLDGHPKAVKEIKPRWDKMQYVKYWEMQPGLKELEAELKRKISEKDVQGAEYRKCKWWQVFSTRRENSLFKKKLREVSEARDVIEMYRSTMFYTADEIEEMARVFLESEGFVETGGKWEKVVEIEDEEELSHEDIEKQVE